MSCHVMQRTGRVTLSIEQPRHTIHMGCLLSRLVQAKKLLYARKHDLAPPPAIFQVRDQSRAVWLF